jgi:glyoxylase-like metal-dependent hydrolase (beta-lactamase superfamily II)
VSQTPVIHHLGCGTMCPHGGRLISGQGSLLGKARIICHCLLVEGADGLVLIDTGLGLDDMRNTRRLGAIFDTLLRPQAREEETAIEQVRALGFAPEDVRHLVPTHLDVDPLRRTARLPRRAGARARTRAARGDEPELARTRALRRGALGARPQWVEHELEGDEWMGFESVRVLPGSDAEILLVPLVGHTRGHTGVAVQQDGRWILHCGDAFFHRGELQTPPSCPRGLRAFQAVNSVDNAKRRQNSERLRELALREAGQIELFCAHDPVMLERLQAGG